MSVDVGISLGNGQFLFTIAGLIAMEKWVLLERNTKKEFVRVGMTKVLVRFNTIIT